MTSFIRAAEIWLPASDHSLLEFGAGAFGEALSFAAVSRAMCFGRAEGLPGEAWDLGHPVLLKQFEGSHFRRTSAAKAAGLTCAVAIPFFVSGKLTAVVTLFGSDDQASKGAMELWRNDTRISSDMTLLDGYYGGLPPEFERLSRDTFLPRGTGLPGMAWQRDEAVIMGQADTNARFLRGDAATGAGICRAMAMPCCATNHASYVLMLLSGRETPIARRMERWMVDRAGAQLVLAAGHCELAGDLAQSGDVIKLLDADALLTKAVGCGVPALTDATKRLPGSQACLWLPVLVEDKVTELVALYL